MVMRRFLQGDLVHQVAALPFLTPLLETVEFHFGLLAAFKLLTAVEIFRPEQALERLIAHPMAELRIVDAVKGATDFSVPRLDNLDNTLATLLDYGDHCVGLLYRRHGGVLSVGAACCGFPTAVSFLA